MIKKEDMNMSNLPITHASLNLTQSCDLNCSYCFNHSKTSKRMTFETGKKCINFILSNAQEANVNQLSDRRRYSEISFWGGEPLLEWELMKNLVLYAEDTIYKDVLVGFGGTTNGVLLTEDKLGFLSEHRAFFMVSLDGTQETHDKYRRMGNVGSHSIIMKNMEKVLERWPFCRVRMSPYAEGIHRFCEDIKYLVSHGINNIMFSPVYESEWNEDRWNVWEQQCYAVVDFIAEKRKQGVMVEVEHFKSYAQPSWQKYPCGAGRHYCLTGDTSVSSLNGTEILLKDLVDKENFWVYSCKEDGEIVPGKVNRVWKTGTKSVIKVMLDNGEFFKCTEDHLLMVREGTYKEAKDCLDESLMPLRKEWFRTDRSVPWKEFYQQQKATNHKVIKLEYAGYEDVYDMEIEKYHNFALTAGVFVHNCGFDTEGEIFICHRFSKFDDDRPWQQKEGCIGHVDHGITKPEVRDKLLNFNPVGCDKGICSSTPCRGGCPAVNADLTGDLSTPSKLICRYVALQTRVSEYYKKKVVEKTTTPQQVMETIKNLETTVLQLEGRLKIMS